MEEDIKYPEYGLYPVKMVSCGSDTWKLQTYLVCVGGDFRDKMQQYFREQTQKLDVYVSIACVCTRKKENM